MQTFLHRIGWFALAMAGAIALQSPLVQAQSAPPSGPRILSTFDAWKQVYEKLPDFPLENQYINAKTGAVDTNNTLANRLIRYHIYSKGRAPAYRLDWKYTLADYLGVNDVMEIGRYPNQEVLTKNPLDGDRAAIARLNRKQREALVQVLVGIFTPAAQTAPASTSRPNPQASPTPATGPTPLPRPGDARLLMP